MYVHVKYCNHLQSIAISKYILQYYCNIYLDIAIFLKSTSKMDCGFLQYIADQNIRLQYIATFLQYIAAAKIWFQYIAKRSQSRTRIVMRTPIKSFILLHLQ